MSAGRALPWILVAALAGILLYKQFGGTPHVRDAAQDGRVQVSFGAIDDRRATLTVARAEGVSGAMALSVPAGTILNNANPAEQRLLTARSVAVELDDETPSVSVELEVYCLDHFALTPSPSSTLSFASADSETEETEPVRVLAQCMEKSSASYEARKLAVWLVADGHLDIDRIAAGERLSQSYREQIREELETRMDAVPEELRKRVPGISQDQIDNALARFRSGYGLENEISRKAREQADRDIQAFSEQARIALDGCVDNVGERAFFR